MIMCSSAADQQNALSDESQTDESLGVILTAVTSPDPLGLSGESRLVTFDTERRESGTVGS